MDTFINEEKGVRQLHLGSPSVQGAMRIARPHALELEYTREMMAPLLLNPSQHWPRNALFIGLGVGALPKFLHRYRPNCKITVVEISDAVLAVAQMHFKLPVFGPNFSVKISCGADFMATDTHQFDLIMVDGFDGNGKAGPLNSTAFYLNCKARLSEQGYFVANLLMNQKDAQAGKNRLIEAFDKQALVMSPCSSGNVIALAHAGAGFDVDQSTLTRHAEQLKKETDLNLNNMVTKLIQAKSEHPSRENR